MKLTILAVGKARKTAEAELCAEWLKRCPFPTNLQEFESAYLQGKLAQKTKARNFFFISASLPEHSNAWSASIQMA